MLLSGLAARAQLVADGRTNTLNQVTNTVVGDVTVGTNGLFTVLNMINGALLSNSGDGYIGYNSGAKTNTVRVSGTNSLWNNSGILAVGWSGSGNQLVVSNGAAVVANIYGYLG